MLGNAVPSGAAFLHGMQIIIASIMILIAFSFRGELFFQETS